MEQNPSKNTPKDVFLHLFNILTFYLSVISLITLYIQYINVKFPDPLNFYFTGIAAAVRVFSAMIIIAVPAYLLSAWMLSKDLLKYPVKRDFKLRKWLVYFTLFISAIAILVDLITFVYNFLSGELTIQFFLKVMVVLIVAGGVFGYYLWDLKRLDLKSKLPKILAWVIVALVIITVTLGLVLMGSPATQRERRFDDTRVQDLQSIQSSVVNYWQQKQALPVQLKDLEDSISGFKTPVDPETNQPYQFTVTGKLSFDLCADFKTNSADTHTPVNKFIATNDPYQQNWDHGAAKTCFNRFIDPELYKPIPAVPSVKVVPN